MPGFGCVLVRVNVRLSSVYASQPALTIYMVYYQIVTLHKPCRGR